MADYRKLSELHEWTDNPREASKIDMDNLRWGLEKYGMLSPLLILEDGTVIGGNHRLKVLRELGQTEAWVNVVHPKNEAEKLEIAMLDNQQTANWLNDKLAELINKYKDDIEVQRIKIDIKSQSIEELLQEFAPEPEEDEFDGTLPEEPVSKLGEVYQLGRHRIMCGDSTKIEDVEKLMDGQKADMVFTDPPYGMDLDTDYTKMRPDTEASRQFQKAKGKTTNKNYDRVIGDSEEWIFDSANHFDCAEQFWWGADWYRRTLPAGGSWFVWDKRQNDDGSNLDDMFGSVFELCWSKTRHKREIARIKYASLFGTEREDIKKRLHPTQKPILLAAWFIERFSKTEWLIADLFLGSGSTLIACEQTNRICYGMELDPKYVDVIRKRYAKFIGQEDNWEEITPAITDIKQT